MKICPVCGKELDDAVKFCMKCGADLRVAPAEETAPVTEETAPAAEAPVAEEVASTQAVTPEAEPQTPAEESAPAEDAASKQTYEDISSGKALSDEAPKKETSKEKKAPAKGKKKGKKGLFIGLGVGLGAILLGAVAIILAVAIAVGAIFIFAPKAPEDYLLYYKDGELYYSDFKVDPVCITQRLVDGGVEDVDEFLYEESYSIDSFIQITADRSKIFFVDRFDPEEGNAVTIYYRDLKDPESPAEKLDSGINLFVISEKGDRVVYCKDGDLYLHDLTERIKLESDVKCFASDAKCEKLVYVDDNGGLYAKIGEEEAEKLDSGVVSLYGTEKLDVIYYTKEDGFFKCNKLSEKEKICSGKISVDYVYETGEVYYFETVEEEIPLKNFVEDDLAAADSAMKEPIRPDFDAFYDNYYDFWDAYDAYNEAYDEYLADYELYEDKIYRDSLRELIGEEIFFNEEKTLYYYDGKKTEKLAENFDWSRANDTDEAIIVYGTNDMSKVGKIKFSEIDDTYEIRSFISEERDKTLSTFIAFKNKATELSVDGGIQFKISPDGKKLWYISDLEENSEVGELYQMDISGGKVGKASLYDSDVGAYYGLVLYEENCLYFKDCEDWVGTLCMNKQEIDYDVYAFTLTYDKDYNTFYYITDWDEEEQRGTLKSYDGEKKKLADDVIDFTLTPNGKLIYLSNYDIDYYSGELWVYDGKEAEMLDDVVTGFARIYENHPGRVYYVGYDEYY